MSRSDDGDPVGRDERPAAGRGPSGVAGLATLLGGETPASRTFITGLIAGALVGAAVAGGSWLRRWSRRGG
jgi:hypothetical protein